MTYYHIIILLVAIQSVYTQQTDPQSESDSVCIATSANASNVSIAGRYNYLYFDPVLSAPTYYNNETNTFLYPFATQHTYTYQYIISSTNSTSSSNETIMAKCAISVLGSNNFNFNPDIFFENWQIKTNNSDTWIVDPTIRLVNCNDICVTNNAILHGALFDGTYVWDFFDFKHNSSVYVCQECILNDGAYLFGWVYAGQWWIWELQPLHGGGESANTLVYCFLGENLGPQYVFNLDDCVMWQGYDGSIEFDNPEMSAKKCDDRATGAVYVYF